MRLERTNRPLGLPGRRTTRSDRPAVSVVMPTYNQAAYLPDALLSVLSQTFRNFELIVVNDGSTDETPAILTAFQREYGFSVIHQANQKLPAALNAGFRAARGRYLTWTSSDNMMLPSMLEHLVSALDAQPSVAMVYADWELIDDAAQALGSVRTFDFSRALLMRVNFINACFLYRRECQEAVGLYDPDYLHVEDWEYWWRIAQRFRIERVPRVLYRYRVHSDSLTHTAVATRPEGRSKGYDRLAQRFRRRALSWYSSKLLWEWMRWRLGGDPRERLSKAGALPS